MYLLDKNENLLLIVHDFENDNYKRQVNNEWSYSFEIDSKYKNYIKRKNKVAFKDKDNNLQLFFIDSIDEESIEGIIIVNCLHDHYSLNDTIVEDKRAINATCQEALTKLLEGSSYIVGDIDEFGEYDINFYFISRLEGLTNIINKYGGEFNFRYELSEDNKSIGKKIIDIKHRLGSDTGLRCCYDTNLDNLKRHVSPDNHFTVLYGRGGSLETESGGYTRKLTFGDIIWQTPTNPADKHSGQNYIEDLEAIEKWGRIEGIYENDKVEDKSILLENTWLKLQEVKDPSISYEASIKDISNIEGFEHYKYMLGDTIIIENDDIETIIEARIIEENYSIKAVEDGKDINVEVILGNLQKGITDNINSDLEDLNKKVNDNDKNISDTNFPNELPAIPVLSLDQEGFASLALSWTYEAKSYYTYILYASQIKDFNPSEDNIIYKGNGSTFWHQVNFSETWYYRVRVKNTHGKYTDFSNQVSGTTYKIKDGTAVFENAAIKDVLIGTLRLDRGWVGKLDATNLDVKGKLTVTDGNENITFEVTSEGLIKIIQGLISINHEGIKINLVDSEESLLGYVLYDGQGMQIFDTEGNSPIAYFTREGSYIEHLQVDKINCYPLVQIATRNGCSKKWYIAETQTGDGSGRDENNKACSLQTVLNNIKRYGIFYLEKIDIYIESGYIKESIVIQDIHGTVINFHISKGVTIETDKFILEDCSARIFIEGDTNEVLATDEEITSDEINSRALIKTTVSNLFSIRNCNYINISGLIFRGIGNGYVASVINGSKAIIKDCDISNFESIFYTDDLSQTVLGVSRGNVKNLSYIGWGGLFTSTSQIPKYTDENMTDLRGSGIHHVQSAYVQYDTLYKVKTTDNISSNKESIFELTNLYTTVEGIGQATAARKGYVGQGKFKSYKSHRGHATIPTAEILKAMEGKINPILKLVLTRLNTSHGYNSETPHPVIRTKGTESGATSNYWDTNVKFNRGAEKTIVLDESIVNGIKAGAKELEFWAEDNQLIQYSFFNKISIIVEGENTVTEDIIDMTQVVFSGAEELVECAMTHWRACDKEYDGTSWSQGLTYRSSNTPFSAKCVAEQDVEYSLWVNCNGNHYKAIDCSSLAIESMKGYSYEDGPYANKANFEAFRKDKLQVNTSKSWALNPLKEDGTLAREAAAIAEFFYRKGWIIPLESIGNEADNYSGLNTADFVFQAKKNPDGTWKRPDRFMKISHVAIVKGIGSDGNKQFIESTTPTTKKHTVGSKEYSAGVMIRAIKNASPDTIVLVGRIKG